MQKYIVLFSILLGACAAPATVAPSVTNVPTATSLPSATPVATATLAAPPTSVPQVSGATETESARVAAVLTASAPQPKAMVSATAPTAPSSAATPTASAQRILISAHRGGAGLSPENTLASFRKGMELGADFIEMDIHLTKDGVAVVIHDPTIDRTTDGRGRVADMTLAQLQTFNDAAKFPGGWATKEPVPTLAQVLDLAKSSNVRLEVEIKVDANSRPYPGIAQKVLDEINARAMLDRVRIMAFEFNTLKEIRAINPRVTTIALMTGDYFRGKDPTAAKPIVDEVAPFANGIGVDKSFLTPQLTREAQNRKMLVGVWTVDSDDEMKKFIAMGVDSITSNRPDLLKQVLGY